MSVPVPAAPGGRRLPWRRLGLLAVVLGVTLAHLGAGRWWFEQRLGAGASEGVPKAIEVAFVKELSVAPAPAVRAAPPPRRARPVTLAEAAAPAASAASAVETAASEPVLAQTEPPVAPETPASAPVVVAEPAVPATDSIDWPPSTQLLYTMVGNYRGPIQGEAEVDWLRDADHYQVRLEVRVPPLFTRRMLSDGQLGPEGLNPRRYDQETQVALQSTRRETVRFEGDEVLLPNGKTEARPPGVQDIASQFVQMTWMFLSHPERLQVGARVEFPLALTRRVGHWTYEVADRGEVALPFGGIDAFHLVPKKDLLKPNELSVETWVAPGLLYLPVRIVIRQDAETWLDLQLKSRPKVAGPVRVPS